MISFQDKKIGFGDLHCHTGFSDGQLTPKEAFLHARELGNLDFIAVTDHAASITEEKFKQTREAADACTNESFVGIAGCEDGFDDSYVNEYGVLVQNGGELIVLNSDTWCSQADNLEEFAGILGNHGNAIAGFAHPQEASWPTDKIWNGYDMPHNRTEKVQSFARMIEVCNETSSYNLLHEKLYPTALDCGFRVSAIAVSDTHQNNWGCKELRARTAVYIPSLTRENIFAALKNQQCYATETGNTLLDFSINQIPMGGCLPLTTHYDFLLDIVEPNPEEDMQITVVEVISDYGKSIYKETVDSHQLHLNFSLENDTARYFYIRVANQRGERIWSSPIWTGREFDIAQIGEPLEKLDKLRFLACSPLAENLFNNNPDIPFRCTEQGQEAVIDLGGVFDVSGIGYHRHTIPYNNITEIRSLLNQYCYSLSMDGKTFFEVANGVINNYGSEQICRFPKRQAAYLKVKAISSIGSDAGWKESFPTIGEISVYSPNN